MTNLGHIYSDIVCDKAFRRAAALLVAKSGVRSDLKGCACLTDAIILYGTAACKSFCEIYRIIAELRHAKTKTVMREMSYCISQSSELPENLTSLTGAKINLSDIRCGLVISGLGELFKLYTTGEQAR